MGEFIGSIQMFVDSLRAYTHVLVKTLASDKDGNQDFKISRVRNFYLILHWVSEYARPCGGDVGLWYTGSLIDFYSVCSCDLVMLGETDFFGFSRRRYYRSKTNSKKALRS